MRVSARRRSLPFLVSPPPGSRPVPRSVQQRRDAIAHSGCQSYLSLLCSVPLAAGEKAGWPSPASSFETQRHHGSSYWRRPGTATARFRHRPPRSSPSPAVALSLRPPPPPFHHGRLYVVQGEAGPLCPIALTASPSPLGAGPKGTSLPHPLRHRPGRLPAPYLRGRTPLSPTSCGRNLGFSLLLLASAARQGSRSTSSGAEASPPLPTGAQTLAPAYLGANGFCSALPLQRQDLEGRPLAPPPQERPFGEEGAVERTGTLSLPSPTCPLAPVPGSPEVLISRTSTHPLPGLFPSPGCSHGVTEGKGGSSSYCCGSSGRWRRSGSRSPRRGEAATFNQFGCQG